MRFRQFTLNGERGAYLEGETKFFVQMGRGKKGSYKTIMKFDDVKEAVDFFNGMQIKLGEKKRIFVPTFKRPVLVKLYLMVNIEVKLETENA